MGGSHELSNDEGDISAPVDNDGSGDVFNKNGKLYGAKLLAGVSVQNR